MGKENLSNGMENMEKEAKEDWEVVKEEAREDWNKFDLNWNKVPPSDSEIVPAEREEAGGTEREEDNMYSTQDYIDEFERILIKVDSDEDFIVTEEDATVTKCSNLCFMSQSSERQD